MGESGGFYYEEAKQTALSLAYKYNLLPVEKFFLTFCTCWLTE